MSAKVGTTLEMAARSRPTPVTRQSVTLTFVSRLPLEVNEGESCSRRVARRAASRSQRRGASLSGRPKSRRRRRKPGGAVRTPTVSAATTLRVCYALSYGASK